MSLTGADVAEILRLLENSSFDELELELDGTKLVLRRNGAPARAPAASAAGAATTASSATAEVRPSGAATATAAVACDAPGEDLPSPLLGTFYRAPRPGAPPFVEVGSEVQEDTVVAIIEVMKLMNSVRAGVRGKVTAIHVADGTLVEYGQPLLRIERG